jgi:uncharacterized protein (TIGR02118 family)
MYKLYAFWSAPKPEDVDAFEDYYLNVHVPLASKVPHLERIVMVHTGLDAFEGGSAPHYRVAEMVFPSKEALEESEESEEFKATRVDSGKIIERFGVTLQVGLGEEIVGEIPARS